MSDSRRARILLATLPPDPWWPRRVQVRRAGDCVPYHLMLLWHFQFLIPRDHA